MNFGLVSRLLSVVMVIIALAFALCLCVSILLDNEPDQGLTIAAFGTSLATSLIAAGFLYWVGRKAPQRFYRREALSVIGLGWILSSLLGSIPFLIATPHIGISGAIFESVSGITTTGASVLSDLEQLPHSILFWRSLSQWIGGMGVVVFFVAILGFLGAGAKLLYSNEASGSTFDFEESRVQSAILRLIYVYLGLSACCTIAYRIAGMSWFDAVCHMFTTVATGGFSTRTESIAAFDSAAVESIGIVFMTLGAISFPIILATLNGRFRRISTNTEFKAFVVILLASSAIVSLNIAVEAPGDDVVDTVRSSIFQTVSILTTTGFATEDFARWPSLPQAILVALMIIGGCSGSTAGGIKINRLVVALRLCVMYIERSFRSRVVRQIRINNRTLSESATQEIGMYLILTGAIFLLSVQIASVFEMGTSMGTNLSAVQACLFNIGPGFAGVGPTETYDSFHSGTKLFLSLLMILGRLELYAVLALLAPSMWKRLD